MSVHSLRLKLNNFEPKFSTEHGKFQSMCLEFRSDYGVRKDCGVFQLRHAVERCWQWLVVCFLLSESNIKILLVWIVPS